MGCIAAHILLLIAASRHLDYKPTLSLTGGLNVFKNRAHRALFCLSLLLVGQSASAIDLLRFHCSRLEKNGDQYFLSEIRFLKPGTSVIYSKNTRRPSTTSRIPGNNMEGEVISYLLQGSKKSYVSGYSLYSVYVSSNQVIAGLTGDPLTRADGSFSLRLIDDDTNQNWLFSYASIVGESIQARFKCKTYRY